jgi:hypothetical protein
MRNNVIVLFSAITLAAANMAAQQSLSASNTVRSLGNGRWEWTVFIQASPTVLQHIACVEYQLDPTFPNPRRLVCEQGSPNQAFPLTIASWGGLSIPITVQFEDKTTQHFTHGLSVPQNSRPTVSALLNNARILAVGISRFQELSLNLRYPAGDAQEVASFLRSKSNRRSEMVLLLDAAATKEAIERTWHEFLYRTPTTVPVVLYFSGRGQTWEDQQYLLSYDTDRARLPTTGIRLNNLIDELADRPAVIILDNCFETVHLPRLRSTLLITSQGYALEDANLRHGVLTYFLLEGLAGRADFNDDSQITTEELTKYLAENVAAFTSNRGLAHQTVQFQNEAAGQILLDNRASQ